MKAFTVLFDIVPGWIWAMVCAGLFGWGGVNAYRVNSAQNDLAQFKAAQAEAIVAAQTQAAEQTASLERTKNEAIKQAQSRAAENAAAAGRAKSELARLRESSAIGARHASTSSGACTEYATTATDVLNECGGALVELAATADGHVNDIKTLTGSWPAWDKFASEMTDFTTKLKGNTP
jgi:phage-related minor tail protein